MCPGRQTKSAVHEVDEMSVASDDDYFLYIESVDAISEDNCPCKIFASMPLINHYVRFQLYCGATVNILPVNEYKQISNDPALDRLNNTTKTLQMFNKTTLKALELLALKLSIQRMTKP